MTNRSWIAVALLCMSAWAHADADLQSFVESTLNDVRDRNGLPAVATLVQIDGRVAAEVAVGKRMIGEDRAVTTKDLWHLGSDTKAMTATLIARLVEQGLLRYDDTMAKLFPGVAARMNPEFHDVTVAQLLSHTSGLPSLSSDVELTALDAAIKGEKGIRSQRAAVVVYYLSRRPATKVGEFSYSNIGYTILGAIAGERAGESWEDLIRSEVWKPLGIKHAGFGPPGTLLFVDQPMGHEWRDGKYVPLDPAKPESDNPPVLGPAGTVHMSLRDWMLFAQDQLDGERGHGKLLKPESYRLLHSAVAKNYAYGWGVLHDKDGALTLLTHTGSNGYWVADVRIMPKHNVIVLTTINAGGDAAEKADRDIGKALQDHLRPYD
ncbi:MAG TPA: serine hydrolase domain-containing protein [Steroidobacteraceae bacterium]|jgi:CubicO group peptidase (beta-lactamase class C family)|nr:serine hydrolase domain-containing protein [Steroidobacteraceae bacterium]